jgi:hypothetical protein
VSVPLLVVHDVFDAAPVARWAPLVDGWDGPTLLPVQPGHGEVPPPEGGNYGASDAAVVASRAMAEAGWSSSSGWPVVVGEGWGAYAAELLAMAGRARALVLVDGLGGEWCDSDALIADQHRWLRALRDDRPAWAPVGGATPSPDPRLAHGFPTVWDRAHTAARRATITVPVVAVETPRSPTPARERDARAAQFAAGAVVREVGQLEVASLLDLHPDP